MRCITNNQTKFKVVAIFALLAFASTLFASGLSVGRIIPKGKVTLFQGNQKVGEFSSEAPFPEGALLSVQGECGVKMSDLYLVAIDKSLFSLKTYYESRKLFVKNGTVYFALSATPHILVFQTPDGVVTTHQILLNVSTKSGLLKGYVSVSEGITRVGVLEGGSILLSVGDGETKRIDAGQELRLAQAGLFEEKEGEKEEPKAEKEKIADKDKGWSTTTKVLIGLGVVGGGVAAFAGGGGGGGGGGAPVISQSAP
ncbi:MAG: hypothetical protein JRF31_12860 [Deltaproteobacteria bacterium]|nr:hypothetical protein [Deltaproteobacteria bacterium]MBW1957231.1 hypothetical protein [Deltaproteobacteria bacterium]MBW2012345.1 hypothetical protein [Deltaproteobacteria bacterium]MBW2087753.1 hypothetical protein [Deltaproteobacteria bacterium]MBW2321691.1 hypothetical protein [Deltaproteobacteria bacterium]